MSILFKTPTTFKGKRIGTEIPPGQHPLVMKDELEKLEIKNARLEKINKEERVAKRLLLTKLDALEKRLSQMESAGVLQTEEGSVRKRKKSKVIRDFPGSEVIPPETPAVAPATEPDHLDEVTPTEPTLAHAVLPKPSAEHAPVVTPVTGPDTPTSHANHEYQGCPGDDPVDFDDRGLEEWREPDLLAESIVNNPPATWQSTPIKVVSHVDIPMLRGRWSEMSSATLNAWRVQGNNARLNGLDPKPSQHIQDDLKPGLGIAIIPFLPPGVSDWRTLGWDEFCSAMSRLIASNQAPAELSDQLGQIKLGGLTVRQVDHYVSDLFGILRNFHIGTVQVQDWPELDLGSNHKVALEIVLARHFNSLPNLNYKSELKAKAYTKLTDLLSRLHADARKAGEALRFLTLNNPGAFQSRSEERKSKGTFPRGAISAGTRTTKESEQIICMSCGRPNHKHMGCYFKHHPDRNPESVPFKDSVKGKQWKALGYHVLPADLRLDGSKAQYPRINNKDIKMKRPRGVDSQSSAKKPKQGTHLNSLTPGDGTTLPAEVFLPDAASLPIRALLDTGNLSHSFISCRIADELEQSGLPKKPVAPEWVRGAIRDTVGESKYSFQITVTLVTPSLKAVACKLHVRVLDISHDLIIGRNDLVRFNLLELFKEHFTARATFSQQSMLAHVANVRHVTELLHSEPDGDDRTFPLSPLFDPIEYYSDDKPSPDGIPTEIHGSDSLKRNIRMLCMKYKHIFSSTVRSQAAIVTPMILKVNDQEWFTRKNRQPARVQSAVKQKDLKDQIDTLERLGVIRPSQANAYSQVLLTPKPNGSWRFCIDFRSLNSVTESLSWPIPNIKHMLRRIGDKKAALFGVMDLTSGYHQTPLDPESIKYTAFTTFMGIYEWLRVPMGLKGAGSYFQQIMSHEVLASLLYNICEVYLDDVLVHGSSETEFLENLEATFKRFTEKNITLNPAKCKLGLQTVEFVGHQISQRGITFSREKINKLVDFKQPHTIKELQAFLGLANYFRDHIRGHSLIVSPLQALIKPKQGQHKVLEWTSEATSAFDTIKERILSCPTLYFVDENAPIFLETDASDTGHGAYLYQRINNEQLPIAFISKSFTPIQKRWSTFEHEAYAIVYALQKLDFLLRDVPFTLRTDHQNLVYIDAGSSAKVKRWKLMIQEFNFSIEHIPGKDNIVADVLSRLPRTDSISVNLLTPSSLPEAMDSNKSIAHILASLHSVNETEADEEFGKSYSRQQRKIIGKLHNSQVGHFGVEKTLNRLRSAGHNWNDMRKHVRQFIKACPCCQKMSYIKVPILTKGFVTSKLTPMQQLAIDTIGPLPVDTQGNQFIIVIIDSFTRFVELYPTKTADALSAATALLDHAGRYGFAEQILSDNGSQFVADIVKELLSLLGTDEIHSLPYSHEENSLVERANKEVLRHLRAMVFHKTTQDEWSLYLPIVQRIINSSVHSSIGCSPAQLLFGNVLNLDRCLLDTPTAQPTTSISEWADKMLNAQSKIVEIAQRIQLDKQTKHLSETNEAPTDFPVNSFVLVSYPYSRKHSGPPSKLHTNYKGPYQVQSRIGNHYKVLNLITQRTETFHVAHLKRYEVDPDSPSPLEIAAKDNQFYLVEKVLDHRGDMNVKSSLEFLVQWLNYDSSQNTWTSWKNLRTTHALHDYLRQKGLFKLIPPQFRKEGDVIITSHSSKLPIIDQLNNPTRKSQRIRQLVK